MSNITVLDANNLPKNIAYQTNDLGEYVISPLNTLAIASGKIEGYSTINKFGRSPDFDIADGFVTLWDGADDAGVAQMTYVFSSTADIDSISSSDNSDTVDIEIQGLDSNYDLLTQTVTLTGQTRVPIPTAFIRVHRMRNVGSTDIAGDVYCYVNTTINLGVPIDSTKIRAIINNGNNQTQMCVYTIPNGKIGLMRSFYASMANSTTLGSTTTPGVSAIRLQAREEGGVFQVKQSDIVAGFGTSRIQHFYDIYKVFQPKTDIVLQANTTINGSSVEGGFDIILMDE